MPASAITGTPPLYSAVAQSDLVSNFGMDDERRHHTSAGPDDDLSKRFRVFSRSSCLTLSLCVLCSLVTFMVTITVDSGGQASDWLPTAGQCQQHTNKGAPIPDSHTFLPSTHSLPGAYTSYSALSTAKPLHSPLPPSHNSTSYHTNASDLPLYISTTHVDHTQTARAYHLIDQAMAGAGRWPGRVDLMVRTTTFSVVILPLMFQSIELFWPKNIGRCIVVADELYKDRWQMRFSMPEWCELHFEYVLPEMAERGRWAMQWHDFWGDNYTSADYVAVADTDSYFTYKITPDVLFDAQGRVVMSIDKDFQRGLYEKDTVWWLGDQAAATAAANANMSHLLPNYPLNFMQNLPIVMPTEMYPAFREYVMSRHRTDELTHFDAVNKDFMPKMVDPSQFCILGNYWLYFAPPHIRNKLHIVYTDHSTLDIDRQLLGLPAVGDDALERTYQIFLKATVHVPHNSYYRGHPTVKRKHPEDKIDPPSLYDFTQKQFHTAVCESQKHWQHIDQPLRAALCSGVTADDRTLHMDLSMLYCYFESGWIGNMHRRDLSVPHAYEAKWGWMGEIVNAGYKYGLDAAIKKVRQYPTHVEWDREQQRLKAEAQKAAERRNRTTSATGSG